MTKLVNARTSRTDRDVVGRRCYVRIKPAECLEKIAGNRTAKNGNITQSQQVVIIKYPKYRAKRGRRI